MATLFTVTLDTEEEWPWHASFPARDFTLDNIAELPKIQELCARHGARPTFFTNRAVLADPGAKAVILDLAGRAGVEIAMHVHPWNTPPIDESREGGAYGSFLLNLPAKLIEAKLACVYETFERAGLHPITFRGGRYSSGGVIHEFLRSKGFIADASVVPFTTWVDPGAPDFRRRGNDPVRLPPRREGERPLWEIPLTVGFTRPPFERWAKWHNRIRHSWLSHTRLMGVALRLGMPGWIWLNMDFTPVEDMLALLPVLRRMRPPCICFTMHTSSLVAGKNPYSRSDEDVNRLYARADKVLGLLSKWPEFEPATVSEVAQHLEANYHESDRHQPA
jgi:hypothetical protein